MGHVNNSSRNIYHTFILRQVYLFMNCLPTCDWKADYQTSHISD